MRPATRFPAFGYKLLIVIATIIWGASFVYMKEAVEVLHPAWLLGIRFTTTAVLLGIIFFRHVRTSLTRPALLAGAVLGAADFLAFWVQTTGLAHTTPGKNAFLTATYCVIVPFIYWLLAARKPTVKNIVAAVLCVIGIGFVSLGSGDAFTSIGFGDGMSLLGAVFFALHIVLVSRFAPGRDILALTVFQFATEGLCGLALGAITEPWPTAASFTPSILFNLAYLVVFASGVSVVFQNVALAHVSANQGALLLSLESVFGVVFSVMMYGEELTVRLLAGFALIFGAILVSELSFKKKAAPPPEDDEGHPFADLLDNDPMAAEELERPSA